MKVLGKLRTPFDKKNGSTTAGNCSQITDGAAVILLARRSIAEQKKWPILAKFVSYAVEGCNPLIMGVGPAVAIPKVLRMTGITKEDVDIFEINEAFASQSVYCVDKLGIDKKKVNPVGGAIALGHPLGCTGARMLATIVHQMKRLNKKVGCISMCMATGMGAAAIIEI